MGIVIHQYVSLYSFVMGVLWFNAFIILGLIMRKLKFPIKFSVAPLLLLLVLSVLRMFVAVEIPGAKIILSETIYPAIVNFLRHELVSVLGLQINIANVFIFLWVAVAVALTAKFLYDYIGKFRPIMNWFERCKRDEYAESLLKEIIGYDKCFRVYRNECFSAAVSTAFKPYIILPEVEFPPDELRAILLHEWKHIQDKDYLTELIANIICFVFWWNPLVYVLKRNFCFVQELKCDRFSVSKNKSFNHFLSAILLLDKTEKEKTERRMKHEGTNALIGSDDELVDRLEVLALRGESRNKRVLTNVCYSIVIIALFLASYMFTILPAFRESPDVPVPVEDFMEIYNEDEGAFKAGEVFLVDNGDGTFSYYVDGQFVMYVDDSHEIINWVPIRTRE